MISVFNDLDVALAGRCLRVLIICKKIEVNERIVLIYSPEEGKVKVGEFFGYIISL